MSNPRSGPFFREEVTASLGHQTFGAIRLARPISRWIITTVGTIFATALFLFLWLGSINKKARVTGMTVVVGGQIIVTSSNAGVIVRTLVKEGETIEQGKPMFEISTERQNGQGELTSLIAQQIAARQQSLETEQNQRASTLACAVAVKKVQDGDVMKVVVAAQACPTLAVDQPKL